MLTKILTKLEGLHPVVQKQDILDNGESEKKLRARYWNSIMKQVTVKSEPQKTQNTTKQVVTTLNSWIDNWKKNHRDNENYIFR